MITQDQVRAALATVKYPGFSRDIVSFGLVKDIRIDAGDVLVQMALATNDPKVPQAIKSESEAALAQLPGVDQSHRAHRHSRARADARRHGRRRADAAAAIEGVKHVIAVASGKGGVGKSTVAANLARGVAGDRRGGGPVRLRSLRAVASA